MRTPFTTPSGISVEFTGRHALLRVHAAEVDTPLTVRLPPSGTLQRVCATTGVSRRVRVEEPETAASHGPRPHPQRRFRR